MNRSDTTGRALEIGMTPHRGAVDELLEPVRTWPERTTLPPVSEGMPGSRACPPSDRRTLVRNPTTHHHTTRRCNAAAHNDNDNDQHDNDNDNDNKRHTTTTTTDNHNDNDNHRPAPSVPDTAPLLQECRSACRVHSPGARI